MASRLVMARLSIDGVDGVVTGFRKAGASAVEYGRVCSPCRCRLNTDPQVPSES